ncbi:MAG: hypothetical protein AAFX06_12125 [Planctomycetota bacterium]
MNTIRVSVFLGTLLCTSSFVFSGDPDAQARHDAVIVRALERVSGYDYRQNQQAMAAVMRHLERSEGTPEFISLVKRFQPPGIEPKLIAAMDSKDRSAAVEAAALLLEMDSGRKLVRERLASDKHVAATGEVLGLLGNGRSSWLLSEVATDGERGFQHRRGIVAALAKSKPGQMKLIELAKAKALIGDTTLVAGALLARSNHEDVRSQAAKVLPQPAQQDAKPLPPIDELASLKGNVDSGLKLFRGTATCSKCHIVNDHGKEVGPNLSEIGSKLSREAMLTAILAPSAGISHNYEGYAVLTEEGDVVAGLKVSETESEVVIRTADGIDRKLSQDDVVEIKKSEKSIMPENLHHLTGQQGLIDVVEYMVTLKKKG